MDDFGIDTSGFSLFGGDTPDYGGSDLMSQYDLNAGDTQNPGMAWTDYAGNAPVSQFYNLNPPLAPAQFNTPTPDILGSQGMYDQSQVGASANSASAYGGTGTPDFVVNRAGVPVGIDPATGQPTGQIYNQGAIGMPGGGAPNNSGLFGQPGSFLNGLTNPASLLGIGGGLAGLIGTLAGGGMGPKPVMSVPQRAALNQSYGANQNLGQFAAGQSPLQQQQNSLLSAIMSGQGLAQPYAQSVEQAYQPQLGSLYQQAVDQGRRSGFYDSPATSPAGGAILGPGLADLQGQIAQSKLNLMTQLPGLYQNPINAQVGAAQNQATGFSNLGGQYPTQQQQPLGPQVGTQLGSGLQGIGQGIAQQQNQAQNQQFQNSLLQTLIRQQGNNTNMSGTPGGWNQYGGL